MLKECIYCQDEFEVPWYGAQVVCDDCWNKQLEKAGLEVD